MKLKHLASAIAQANGFEYPLKAETAAMNYLRKMHSTAETNR